jgi:hypothetical protein
MSGLGHTAPVVIEGGAPGIFLSTMTSRILYDPVFVAGSNCTLDYDETTNLDTTVGTYVTNYVIGFVGVVSAVVTLSRHKSKWLARYFFITAVAYAIAGVGHQVIDATTNKSKPFIEIVSSLLVLIGLLTLEFSIVSRQKYRIGLVAFLVLVVGLTVGFASTIILAICIALSYFVISLHYCLNPKDYLPALGCLAIAVGMVVQVALRSVCGDAAYSTCWQDCPLKDPMKFNHNALFHVFIVIGLLLQALGGYPEDGDSNEDTKRHEDHHAAQGGDV